MCTKVNFVLRRLHEISEEKNDVTHSNEILSSVSPCRRFRFGLRRFVSLLQAIKKTFSTQSKRLNPCAK